jgi:hypothetical protein
VNAVCHRVFTLIVISVHMYMCVSTSGLVARKAWLRMQEGRAGVVIIQELGLQVVWGSDSVGQLCLGSGSGVHRRRIGGGITDAQHSRVAGSCRCLES